VKKAVLGRGLGALIDNSSEVNVAKSQQASINEIDINKIEANPWQPRSHFDEERLNELATSIREIGIIQPLTLRKIGDDRYQIIAGERRFRASKLAGLAKVPAFVRDAGDETMLEMALVENIQREDLDPIEISISYQRLIDECNLTQESMSERVGKKRSTITNYLRLLRLPAEIQLGLREKQISMGHARAIINVEDAATQLMLFEQIIQFRLLCAKN
jgi:ParB-like partition proteins